MVGHNLQHINYYVYRDDTAYERRVCALTHKPMKFVRRSIGHAQDRVIDCGMMDCARPSPVSIIKTKPRMLYVIKRLSGLFQSHCCSPMLFNTRVKNAASVLAIFCLHDNMWAHSLVHKYSKEMMMPHIFFSLNDTIPKAWCLDILFAYNKIITHGCFHLYQYNGLAWLIPKLKLINIHKVP